MLKILSGVKNFLRHRAVVMFLRIAIGLLFVLASIDKLEHPDQFVDIIMGYHIVPWSTAVIIAIWLPWVELIVGIILIIGVWTRAAALLLSALTAMFIIALGSAIIRGIDIVCGCFSVSELTQARSWASLWQESLLLLGCVWLWVAHWPAAQAPSAQMSNTITNEATNS